MGLQLTRSCSLDRFNGAGKGSEDLTLVEVSLALNPSRGKWESFNYGNISRAPELGKNKMSLLQSQTGQRQK